MVNWCRFIPMLYIHLHKMGHDQNNKSCSSSEQDMHKGLIRRKQNMVEFLKRRNILSVQMKQCSVFYTVECALIK